MEKIELNEFKSFDRKEVVRPAKLLLNKLLQSILQNYLFDFDSDNQAKINFVNGGVEIRPHNLLSYMWYEFYKLTSKDKEIGWCDLCGGPEDISNKRSDWKVHNICNKYRLQKNIAI